MLDGEQEIHHEVWQLYPVAIEVIHLRALQPNTTFLCKACRHRSTADVSGRKQTFSRHDYAHFITLHHKQSVYALEAV